MGKMHIHLVVVCVLTWFHPLREISNIQVTLD